MFKALVAIILCLLFAACHQQTISQSRNDKLYKKENNQLDAKFCVYHLNDSVTELFYDIYNEALIYKKTDTSAFFYSACKLRYKASTEPNYRPISDSGSAEIFDRQMNVELKHLKGSVYLNIKQGAHYYSEISVIDINKRSQYVYPLFIDKSSADTRQNFLIRNSENEISFKTHFMPNEMIYIETQTNTATQYTVDCFSKEFKIAKPPFSLEPMDHFSYQPDSSFNLHKVNGRFTLHLPAKGFFHLKTNDVTKDGVTCFVYEPSYPKISNSTQMILATRYIMNKKEFDVCMYADDQKSAIDKFWLDIAGSNERAKELIKRYYGRVQEANRQFTSHQEGWKTDRGMIYIVFGAPNSVVKRKNGEIWTYGESSNPNALVYSFIKVINPFSDNDYLMERNLIFKMPWYQAVDFWRQGRVYLDN